MDKQKLIIWVEDYINADTTCVFDFSNFSNAHERFLLHTAKRLCRAFDLFKKDVAYKDDFLLALRNYFLVFQTKIRLSNIHVDNSNPYGIVLDVQEQKYFASYQCPEYVNSKFCEDVFLANESLHTAKNDAYDLHTDAFIRKITGFRSFKSVSQKLAVYGALNTPDGYTTLVSLPTGGGKSLITQTISYQVEGLTIVVVPTISLALDQVRVAKEIIKSGDVKNEVFSYSSGIDAAPILKAIKNRTARLLFISPEALIKNEGFSDAIKEANSTRFLKNIIIDEAHIVVDWGTYFRIDYQCLESWRRELLLRNPSIRTILLSATFEPRCISLLKDFFSKDGQNWIEIRCDSLRHEPRFSYVKAKSYTDKNEKMIELIRKMPHPMIIYVACPDDANDIVTLLRNKGIRNVNTYTGMTTTKKREELIDAWSDDQFEIMVATSAFGVGVDKPDVRTVLHMYIPQNANAYYQELGRGGRDGLPCLSIMCVGPDDLSVAFGRISKRVMTTEKIVGRWNSMYLSLQSRRSGNLIYIDSSIKPNYADDDLIDDSPVSSADMNWNIYVLLFLRRYGLLKIKEVLPQSGKYIFVVEIISDKLRVRDEAQVDLIEKYRAREWEYYVDSFQTIRDAIRTSKDRCWSEMFFETYDKVSEFCAGCNAHSDANESDFLDYSLKMGVKEPLKQLAQDQRALFSGARNIITIPSDEEIKPLFRTLSHYRLSVLIVSGPFEKTENIINSLSDEENILVLNPKDLRALLAKPNYYYLSGMIAIQYHGTPREVYDLMTYVINKLGRIPQIRLVHVLEENVYFDWMNKSFTDLVDGPVLPSGTLIS